MVIYLFVCIFNTFITRSCSCVVGEIQKVIDRHLLSQRIWTLILCYAISMCAFNKSASRMQQFDDCLCKNCRAGNFLKMWFTFRRYIYVSSYQRGVLGNNAFVALYFYNLHISSYRNTIHSGVIFEGLRKEGI